MKQYETIFIIVPDLPDEERNQIVARYQKVLTDRGADLLNTDDWGRRRLAYEIKKFSKGHYILVEFAAQPKAVAEMERQMGLDEKIIRFLTVKVADEFDREAYEAARAAKAERARRAAEEAAEPFARPAADAEEEDEGDEEDDESEEA